MKKRKKSTSSRLPSDDFTFTDGSSFGLDTFLHDMEENEGVMQSARLPQTKGFSRIPGLDAPEESQFDQAPLGTGVYGSCDTEEVWDIGLGDDRLDSIGLRNLLGMEVNAKDYVRLPALEWLELETPEEKQDPDRLPHSPGDRGIAELEEAWGVHRRTDGVAVFDKKAESPFRLGTNSVDLDRARYEAMMESEPEVTYRFSTSDLKTLVAEAIRRSAAGQPLDLILGHTTAMLGEESFRVKDSMQVIASEHGLIGKVFIRASSYPGCHNGEWTDLVNKKSKSARYVVAASKCGDCTHNRQSCCDIFQRRLVAQVPWEEAREAYRPRFQTDGVKLASGDPKEALRRAFTEKSSHVDLETYFPKEKVGLPRLEEELRVAHFSDAKKAIQDLSTRGERKAKEKLVAYLGKLKFAGLITEKQTKSILRKGGTMKEIQGKVAAFIHRSTHKEGVHDTGERMHYGSAPKKERPLTAHEKAIHKAASVAGTNPFEIESMLHWTKSVMNEGVMGRDLESLIQTRFAKPVLKAVSHLVKDLRVQHEGLAGHLYVDAEVYGGGKRGIKGCEEGGLRHRANAVPYVVEMEKCGECVFRSIHDKCAKYSKELVKRSDFDVHELQAHQRDNIMMADAPDSKKTASIFAPVENPAAAWGLANNNMENFSSFRDASDRDADALDDVDFADFGLGDGFDL